jgi:hypothetical protein
MMGIKGILLCRILYGKIEIEICGNLWIIILEKRVFHRFTRIYTEKNQELNFVEICGNLWMKIQRRGLYTDLHEKRFLYNLTGCSGFTGSK